MKQSLRLVREVSLSMSWKMESVPGKSREKRESKTAALASLLRYSLGNAL